jgi:hypothetical protein
MGMTAAGLLVFCAGVALAQTAKSDPPSDEAQRKAEKQVRDIFKDDYAQKSVPAQRKLAGILLKQARETKEDPAVQFVLFREASELAARAGEFDTLQGALEALTTRFKIDAVGLKGSFLMKAEPAVTALEDTKKLTEALFQVTREALALDQFDTAAKTALSSLATAKKSKDLALVTRADGLSKSVQEWKTAFENARAAESILKTAPDDPAANQARGEYLSFVKGQWEEGLVSLSRGTDAATKALASKELAARAESAPPLEIADGWWDLSATEKSALRKSRLRSHARALYEPVLPAASGLTRMRIENRLTEGSPAECPFEAPVLATREGLVGWWKFDEGKGTSAADSSGTGNDGALENAAWVAGRKGAALKFNGSTSHVTCKATNLPATHTPQTISWWHFRPAGNTTGNIIIVGNEFAPCAVQIGLAKEKVGIWKLGGEPVMTAPDLRISTWTHGAYSFDGKTHSLYINGKLEASCEVAPQNGVPTRCEFGRWWGTSGSGYYNGLLDEIRIYNRALSPSEIAVLAMGKD